MPIITLDHVSKHFRAGRFGSRTTRTMRDELAQSLRRLLPGARTEVEPRDEIVALRDVSFEVEPGETVGLIGANGSGKSTILKLLAQITYPSRGHVTVDGSVASLIEVGAGFHPELTGRENVYLYGSIMGMRRAEIREKFDSIVEFAGIADFIDLPVKKFSSGMYVRLGFSVAAHINSDVLLVDEVLAVGDASFQSKCLQQIDALRREGTTVIFVSHDMATVGRLCDRVYLLQSGEIRAEGEAAKVIGEYYEAVVAEQNATNQAAVWAASEPPLDAGRDAEIVNVRFLDQDRRVTEQLSTGGPMIVQIEYRVARTIADPAFELLFYSVSDRLQCQFSTALSGDRLVKLDGSGVVEIACDELGLMPGIYRIDAAIVRRGSTEAYDRKSRRYLLQVVPGKRVRGLFYSPHSWSLGGSADVLTASNTGRREQ
jgi:ABC-type polysaccharide/polyol phosphate transport system ATPase subunit